MKNKCFETFILNGMYKNNKEKISLYLSNDLMDFYFQRNILYLLNSHML